MNNERKLLLLAILLAIVIFSGVSFFYINSLRAFQAENTSNICATPPGYTDEQWREHMSHHPDRYAECLK